MNSDHSDTSSFAERFVVHDHQPPRLTVIGIAVGSGRPGAAPSYRLRRLGRHAEAWMLLEREGVIVFEHDVDAIEIAGAAAHLHVVALPDDDDVCQVSPRPRFRAKER